MARIFNVLVGIRAKHLPSTGVWYSVNCRLISYVVCTAAYILNYDFSEYVCSQKWTFVFGKRQNQPKQSYLILHCHLAVPFVITDSSNFCRTNNWDRMPSLPLYWLFRRGRSREDGTLGSLSLSVHIKQLEISLTDFH
jgi:hypothetical protein